MVARMELHSIDASAVAIVCFQHWRIKVGLEDKVKKEELLLRRREKCEQLKLIHNSFASKICILYIRRDDAPIMLIPSSSLFILSSPHTCVARACAAVETLSAPTLTSWSVAHVASCRFTASCSAEIAGTDDHIVQQI
jgi:hypothetical protein